MPRQFVRKDLSALGLYMILSIVLGNLSTAAITTAVVVFSVLRPMMGGGGMPDLSVIPEITASIQSDAFFLLFVNSISAYLVGMGAVALMMRGRIPSIRPEDLPAPERQSLKWTDMLMLVPIIVFLMDAGNLIGTGIARLCGDAAGIEATNQSLEALLSGSLWQTIFFVVIVSPVAEELFFRKFLIDRFSGYTRRGAILVSTLTFAVYHANFYQVFYTAFVGAILAWVYVKTEKIRYPILIHVFVNFFGGIIMPACTKGLLDYADALFAGDVTVFGTILREHPETVCFFAVYYLLSLVGLILLLLRFCVKYFRITERTDAVPMLDFAEAYLKAPGQIAFLLVCVIMAVFSLIVGAG